MNPEAVAGQGGVGQAVAPGDNSTAATDPVAASAGASPVRPRTAASTHPRPRPTLGQRLVAAIVIPAVSIASRLPERLLWRAADVAGDLEYRVAGRRRTLARANLRRVTAWMAERRVGDERFWAAAENDDALEALVRSAFRHHARYYVELISVPRYDARFIRERILLETPELIDAAVSARRSVIMTSGHFGSIELPALFGSLRLGRVTAPMETLRNPGVQAYIERTRASLGVNIVGLDQGIELVEALRRNEPVGIVGDRDITGNGVPVEFFGAPARIPGGLALIAVESGAPVYVASVRRVGVARYRGNLTPLETPSEGTRRERVRAMVQAQAHAYELMIAQAPDQWYGVFFPIWDAPHRERSTGGSR